MLKRRAPVTSGHCPYTHKKGWGWERGHFAGRKFFRCAKKAQEMP